MLTDNKEKSFTRPLPRGSGLLFVDNSQLFSFRAITIPRTFVFILLLLIKGGGIPLPPFHDPQHD